MQTRILKQLVWLTLLMHFMLPYSAMSAEEVQEIHAPPPTYHSSSHSGANEHEAEEHLEELPHHIEAEENELEELDEADLLGHSWPQQSNKLDTRLHGVFFYRKHLANDGLKCPIQERQGNRMARNILRVC